MILHIYHCNTAIISDHRTASGRNRPLGTGRHPVRRGAADVRLVPPTNAFDDSTLGTLLGLFQEVPLDDTERAIAINWGYLERKLELSRAEVEALVAEAAERGLLRGMDIDYDHVRWMKQSADKGLLVIMACVEKRDLTRRPREYLGGVVEAVEEIVAGVVNEAQHQFLRRIVIVPNGHLDPRGDNRMPWTSVLAVLEAIPPVLSRRGFDVSLNSYGHAKMIELAINAHPLGYVLRTV